MRVLPLPLTMTLCLLGTTTVILGGEPSQKDLFLKVRRAAEAPTFEGAKLLLGQIKTDQIDDPDLASLYVIAREIAEFCTDVGIPRDAKVSYIEIVARIDYPSILAKLVDKGLVNAPAEATKLAARASRLKGQIPTYEELDGKLAERFGLAPPPRILARTVGGFAGRYTWRAGDRTIDFDLKADGTFTAYNKPDEPKLEDLVRDGKGTWAIEDGCLTVNMTHVWVGVYWKEFPMNWISKAAIVSATEKEIQLEGRGSLLRK